MGKIRQKLTAVREHWFQILIACGALALAFGPVSYTHLTLPTSDLV